MAEPKNRLFFAEAGTPLPNDKSSDGSPVSIDDQGVTEWTDLGEVSGPGLAWLAGWGGDD